MATYSRADRLAAIQKAGFQNPLTALAISLAEFGENRDINVQSQSDNYFQPGQNAEYPNGGQEQSFGPWQIHLPAHPDVTQACAMELTCSTQKAFEISNGGTNFNPWSTYGNGAYKTWLNEITASLGPIPSPSAGGGASLDSGGSSAGAPPTPCNLTSQQKGSAISLAGGGKTYAEIASAIGAEVRCIVELFGVERQSPGGGIADAVGKKAKELNPLDGLAAAIKAIQDSFRSENLWRAAFVILGAGAIWVGGRMYFHQPMMAGGDLDTQVERLQGAEKGAP